MNEATTDAPVLLHLFRVVATVIVAAAVPIFFVTHSVRSVTLSERFYLDEFTRYRVGLVTGIADDELRQIAHGFIEYFQAPPGRLNLWVRSGSAQIPLFSEREIEHMVDVQRLIHVVFALRVGAIAAFALALAVLFAGVAPGLRAVLLGVTIGSAATLAIVLLLGIAAVADFQQAFYRFHLLSFSNDLWLLDPTRDRLIQLFPQGFFFDCVLRIAQQTIISAVVGLAIGLGALKILPPAPAA